MTSRTATSSGTLIGQEPLAVPSEPIRASAEGAGQDIRSRDWVGFVPTVEDFERRLKLEGLAIYIRPIDSQIHEKVPIHDIVCVHPLPLLFQGEDRSPWDILLLRMRLFAAIPRWS